MEKWISGTSEEKTYLVLIDYYPLDFRDINKIIKKLARNFFSLKLSDWLFLLTWPPLRNFCVKFEEVERKLYLTSNLDSFVEN